MHAYDRSIIYQERASSQHTPCRALLKSDLWQMQKWYVRTKRRNKQTWLWVRYLQQRSAWPKSELEDYVCRQVMRYCVEGWPSHPSLPSVSRPYCQVQNDSTIQNGLLLNGVRLVIPTCMRLAMLDKLHEGHQGVARCRSRAQSSVWWPGPSRQQDELVRSCTACAIERRNPFEPMIASETVLGKRLARTCSCTRS